MTPQVHESGSRAQRARRALIVAVGWVVAVLPPLAYLLLLPRFGRLPYNDYYGLLPQLVVDGRLSANPLVYLTLKSNEHTIALPAAVYAANAALFHGDNRVLSLLALAFMAGGFWLLCRAVPRRLWERPESQALSLAVLSVFTFSWMAAHNVVKGFSGTIWCLANLFAVAAVVMLARGAIPSSARRLAGVVALGVLATLSYSTGLGVWAALIAGALLLGMSRGRLAALVAAAAVVVPLYLMSVERPPHHVQPNTTHPLHGVVYLAAYLGGGVAKSPGAAVALGGVGILAGAALVVAVVRSRIEVRRASAPWVMLMCYGVANGLGTAIGRSNLGVAQALASRYATLSGLFWLGFLGTLVVLVLSMESCRRRRVGGVAASAVAACLVAVTLADGWTVLRSHVENARFQGPAELALFYGIPDLDVLRHVTPFPEKAVAERATFRGIDHVPFDREPRFPYHSVVGEPVRVTGRGGSVRGELTHLAAVGRGVLRIGGWLDPDALSSDELPVVDETGVVYGAVFCNVGTPERTSPSGAGDSATQWLGYVLPPPGARPLWIVATSPEGRPPRPLLDITPSIRTALARGGGGILDREDREALEALGYLEWAEVEEDGGTPPSGVVLLDRAQAQPGWTLITPRSEARAMLVDLEGTVVHEWSLPPVDDTPWQHVHLCSDGDLLVLVKEQAVLRLDPASKLLWSVTGRFHHEVTEGGAGTVLAAARRDAVVRRGGVEGPVLADEIVELTPDGAELARVPLTEVFRHVPAPRRLRGIRRWAEGMGFLGRIGDGALLRPDTPADVFHLNAIQPVEQAIAGVCRPGDLLISVRNLDTIAMIDPSVPRIRWRWGPGELDRQHHPTLLDDGTILVFDNGRRRHASRVVELDPVARRIVWSYEGNDEDPFYSVSRGSAERLPNGNTLVCESDRGRVFEVTASGETVWEYLIPVLSRDPDTGALRRAAVYRAHRVVELPAPLREEMRRRETEDGRRKTPEGKGETRDARRRGTGA